MPLLFAWSINLYTNTKLQRIKTENAVKSMIEQPIPPRPYLRNEVYTALKSRLGEIAAGLTEPVHIREEELARSLGVSRTPVREALRRLEQEGVVTFRPRRGAQLMPTSLAEYLEWLSIREVLEGLAAREVARNGAAIAPRLREIFSGFDERAVVERAADYAKANADFHALIIEQSGNSLLVKAWQSFGHVKMVGLRVIERLNRGTQSLREHQDIIAAIAAGNAERAEASARAHVRAVRDRAASLTKL